MSKMICPGQDTRFWDKSDIFEVACSECGRAVEFFRDDVSRRCPGCGTRLENPKVTLGCAQWCEYAEKCLGYDPKSLELRGEKESSLADQIVQRIRSELEGEPERFARALAVFERAQELLRQEDANPRTVVAAALLADLGAAAARRVLEELDVGEQTVQHVCRIAEAAGRGEGVDTPEGRIASDAAALVALPQRSAGMESQQARRLIEATLHTDTAKRLADERFLPREEET